MKMESMDAENIEPMDEAKREVENKVAKILKLIKNNGQGKKGKITEDSNKRSELVGLIEDFHKQYHSLYAQYNHLGRKLRQNVSCRKEKESSSSSTSSDAEYFSPVETENDNSIKTHLGAADSSEEELETSNVGVSGLKHDEQMKEPADFLKLHEVHGSQASVHVKEPEGQLNTLKIELDSLQSIKKYLQEKIENKATEAKELVEENERLHDQISDLQLMLKEKGDGTSAILNIKKDSDKNLMSRFEDLTAQVNNLQLEENSLHSQKSNLERSKGKEPSAQVKRLKNQVKTLQKELESICDQKTELELQLDMKTKEVTENLNQIETLKGEIERNVTIEKELLKEKEGIALHKEHLRLEVHSLHSQNDKLEELIRSKNQETDQLKEEKERMNGRLTELEEILIDGTDELYTSQKKCNGKENEASTQIMALKEKVNSLQQELDLLLREKIKLERQNERLKVDSAQNQVDKENELLNLKSKIAELQKLMKEREDTIKKFTGGHKLIRHYSLDSPKSRPMDAPKHHRSTESPRLNHHVLERKMEELAEKFQMKMENHIRLLYQRILVAEHIHAETKDGYKKMRNSIERENRDLNEKKVMHEAVLRKLREILLEPGSNVSTGLDLVARKLDEDNANFINRISRISNELQFAKNWIAGAKNEIKKLKHNVDSLTMQLDDKEEKEMLLREKVWNLEGKLSKEGGDKLNAVSQLERMVVDLVQQLKEKDEIMLSLGEEKREAIRQLCILIDYHRNRYDHLKEAITKMTVSRIKKSA